MGVEPTYREEKIARDIAAEEQAIQIQQAQVRRVTQAEIDFLGGLEAYARCSGGDGEMTVAELFAMHAATVAELEAVAPLAGPGDLEARKASREVERLKQKLAKLDEKRRRHRSLNGHAPTCWCGGCARIGAGKISESEPLKMYGINVPESLHAALKKLGSARVRAALEELSKEA